MTRLTRAETKARTRQRLLDAALAVFAKKGYNATSVEEIADRAGFTRGAFYANFDDKADVLLPLLEEGRRQDMAEVADLMAATPDDQKLDAMQGWYDALRSHPGLELAHAELALHATREPKLRRRLAAAQRETLTAVTAMIERFCADAGLQLPVPATSIASLIQALGDGIAAQRRLDPSSVPADAFATGAAYLWWGILASAPAEP